MARAHRIALIAGILATIYFLVSFQVFIIPFVDQKIVQQLLPVVSPSQLHGYSFDKLTSQIPWWLLVAFGSWSLGTLGWGLLTFPECPEAYTELLAVSCSRQISKQLSDLILL
jgi:dolichyl-phosphate mannosyltransferase polypeptide 3